MYHKKYGKMTFSAWLNAELEQTSGVFTVFFGVLLAAAGVAVRLASDNPYQMILQLGIGDLLPPVWLLSLLRFLSLFTVGCAAGMVLGHKNRSCLVEKYRGGMFFILLAVLELCWYPTLFVSGMLFVAVFEAIGMLVLAILVTVSFFKVCRFSGFIMVPHILWLTYLFILTCTVFFKN